MTEKNMAAVLVDDRKFEIREFELPNVPDGAALLQLEACAIAARAAGASCIIVSGLSRDARRLEVARKLGADWTIDVEAEDLVTKAKDYTGGDGVNVVVNVTGGDNGNRPRLRISRNLRPR